MPRRCRGISLPPSRRSRDTSLAEGGRSSAPAGAAGRCGHRPLRKVYQSAAVKRREGQSPSPTDGATRVRSYNVSPSVTAKGRDTSLAEGGEFCACGRGERFITARLGDGGGAKREGTKCAVLHGGFCFVRTFRGKTGSHNNGGKRCGNCAKPLAERVRGGCITLFFVGRW